ncbi:MAG: ribonuclease HII [Deltaproteobacteria bacterium]|nr:ribonuclease HII [Deltaproteobacteria bacterium]
MSSLTALSESYLREGASVPDEVLAALHADPRAGARKLAERIEARRRANRAEGQRLRHLLRFETELYEQGYTRIAGTDEVGMGPLAGPVVAAAVILPRDFRPKGLNDSKQLDEGEHERLCAEVKEAAVAWSIGQVDHEEIDRINIYRAGLLAMKRAVEGLKVKPDYLLLDARTLRDVRLPQRGIIKGDARSLTIAAASVVAKYTRDRLMKKMDERYPGYGFAQHKGYSVPEHWEALKKLGPCPIHRRSFAPVREALAPNHPDAPVKQKQLALFAEKASR